MKKIINFQNICLVLCVGLLGFIAVNQVKIKKVINNEINYEKRDQNIVPTHYGHRYIYNEEDGNEIILSELKKNKPCLIARFGSTELKILSHFFKNMNERKIKFSNYQKELIKNNSGFFPPTDELLTRFSCELINIVKNLDVMAVWNFYDDAERDILEKYNEGGKFVKLGAVGDCVGLSKNPWTQHLAGKKVLVIHPFEKTIQSQYKKRKLLFKNPLVLPEFELKTIKAVQGLGGLEDLSKFKDWFDALDSMCRQIDKIDFDIAIIGAGAYGIFLADYVKKIGKKAVHMGGATQLLFGIKGDRWIKEYGKEFAEKIINEHWVYPLDEETPKNLEKFVKGESCVSYWKTDEKK